MSAVPKKKRRGRPRGSKNKPKVAVEKPSAPPPIDEMTPFTEEHYHALKELHSTRESSFVAGYFGLDKIEGEAINKMLADKIFEERRAACIQENLNPYKVEELTGPTTNPHAGSDFNNLTFEGVHVSVDNVMPDPKPIANLDIPNIPTVWVETDSFASEELKSILRQIDAKVKDLASYPMDHGLRCGMNEVEILLANNRERFSK